MKHEISIAQLLGQGGGVGEVGGLGEEEDGKKIPLLIV